MKKTFNEYQLINSFYILFTKRKHTYTKYKMMKKEEMKVRLYIDLRIHVLNVNYTIFIKRNVVFKPKVSIIILLCHTYLLTKI